MISEVRIQNIQSHKDSTLNFDPGINIIIGSSNNGKSTIMRAINWVVYNRPLGVDSLASHWAINDKGKLVKPMSVSIKTDDGFEVTRRRTADDNQYIITSDDGSFDELNVVKTDVPVEICDILLLNDTNIQKQMDAPFLLSETSGEVAKYFNRIVKLDVIDKVLSSAETKKRNLKNSLENSKKLMDKKTKEHENFLWITEVGKYLSKYERISDREKNLSEEIKNINSSLDELTKLCKDVSQFNFEEIKSTISNLNKDMEKSSLLTSKINSIKEDFCILENEKINLNFNFDTTKMLLKKLTNICSKNNSLNYEINTLMDSMSDISGCYLNIKNSLETIKEYRGQLPEICPLCGNKIIHEVCQV